ncbi:hypothetical protein Clacol_003777 [Clathrus columnatus]|uniref:Sm protein E n=1 Tax=Clathrus columnatus TaxID=1419009 RepID=A0AAV5A4J9_9AGAM|nr:hypothetical protein Clacol_003777 [Clathrus columnatus]
MSGRQQRVMVQPINVIFKNLQQGFDEFMNLVIDDAEEVYVKETRPRVKLGQLVKSFLDGILTYVLGRILLKGDNITLIQQLSS